MQAGLLLIVAISSGCSHFPDPQDRTPSQSVAGRRTESGQRTNRYGDRISYELHLPATGDPSAGEWPVVILLHAFARNHTRQIGNAQILADHGLAVLVPDMTTLMTGERGRRRNVENLEDHLAWLGQRNRDPADPLHGWLDLQRIGVAGHSAGGGIALELAIASANDESEFPVDAVALMDGVPWKKTIGRIESGHSEAALLSIRADPSAWERAGNCPRGRASVEGISHHRPPARNLPHRSGKSARRGR